MGTAVLRSSAGPAQLVRFALAGGVANLVFAALFLLVAGFGSQPANVVASLVSTGVANELHRRLTFRAAARIGWRAAQLHGGTTAAAGLAVSSTALAVHDAVGGAGGLSAVVVVTAVNGAVGLARFVLLRWVFTRAADRSPLVPVLPLRPDGAAGAAPRPAVLGAAA